MDERVRNLLGAGFAADLYETVKAAKKTGEDKAFRHTMHEGSDGMVVFCALYPKADVVQFPGVTEEFAAMLKTFNAVGLVTNMRDRLEYFFLGGQNKPFTALGSAQDLADLLDPDRVAAFLSVYFEARGSDLDLETVSYDDFLAHVEAEVLNTTPLSVLSKISESLNN